jgi:hypothetical protein
MRLIPRSHGGIARGCIAIAGGSDALLAKRYREAHGRALRELPDLTPHGWAEHSPMTIEMLREREKRGDPRCIVPKEMLVLVWDGPMRVRDARLRWGICERCHKEFDRTTANVRYCPACPTPRKSRAKPRQAKPCAQCGEVFTPHRQDANTCSVRCRVALHRAAHSP